MLDLRYYFDPRSTYTDFAERHARACELLRQLHAAGQCTSVEIRTHEDGFPTADAKAQLFKALEEFATTRQIGLARVFGSRNRGFWFLPAQFVLAYRGPTLAHVFPCRFGRVEVEASEALERLAAGEAWSVWSKRAKANRHHEVLVAFVRTHTDLFGPGLICCGTNVPVSRNFAERGFVDVVFEGDAGYLLVEVKVKADELDKAMGQVTRHRDLFIEHNNVSPARVRAAIACPELRASFVRLCASVGIQCVALDAVAVS
jgi:hypothetical protein